MTKRIIALFFAASMCMFAVSVQAQLGGKVKVAKTTDVTGAVKDAANSEKDAANAAVDSAKDAANETVNSAKDAVNDVTNAATDAVNDVMDTATDAVEDVNVIVE